MKPVYLDHHATTPVDPIVLEAMMPFFIKDFGNPSSVSHCYGVSARRAVENSRLQIASLIGALPNEIIFTSGATESNNLVLKGLTWNVKQPANIVTLAIEHNSILDTCRFLDSQGIQLRIARVDQYGVVDLEHLNSLIDQHTILVTIQHANGEIGTVQPLEKIGKLVKSKGVLFHSDAVQSLGKEPVDVRSQHIDMLSLSGHKIYGPKGIGALYIREGIQLTPLIHGGGQENGFRSGTLNVPAIVGFGKAAELAKSDLVFTAPKIKKLRDFLISNVQKKITRVILNGHPSERLVNNAHFSFSFVEGESLMLACNDFALSSGSACSSIGSKSPYVLKAIGLPDALAVCSIRFGLGKTTTLNDLDMLISSLEKQVNRLRELSPFYELVKKGVDVENFDWSKFNEFSKLSDFQDCV